MLELKGKAAISLFFLANVVVSFSPGPGAIRSVINGSHLSGAKLTKPRLRTFAVGRDEDEEDAESLSPSKIDNVLRDIHDQALPFRIVVIGGGAILETTSVLGPHMASSVSPKTGERLVTFASDDRSFEFHLKIDRVGKVTFSEKDKPLESGGKKTMRICRFLTEDGGPICSLILADSSQDAADWFRGLTIRYGYEVQSE